MPFPDPAPEHVQILTFLTPKVRDILFYEHVDTRLPVHATLPDYGTPHPNKTKWPHHELVYATPADQAGWQKRYYALSRESQDDYNFEITYPYAGLTAYPRYTRTYVLPRTGYTKVEKGTADPTITGAKLVHEEVRRANQEIDSLYVTVSRVYDSIPTAEAQETYNYEISYPYNGKKEFPRYTRRYVIARADYAAMASGSTDPVFTDAVLTSEVVRRFSDPLADELYVEVIKTFDTIPDISDGDDADVLETFGYRIERPYGTDSHYRLVWTFPIALSAYTPLADGTACPITGYTGLVLTNEGLTDDKDAENMGMVTRVYDTLPGLTLQTNSKRAEMGVPDKFVDVSTLTVDRTRVANGTEPSTPTGNVTDLAGALVESQVAPEGESGVISWKTDTTSKMTLGNLTGYEMDPMTGIMLPVTIELVAAGTSGTNLSSDGLFSEVDPLNRRWSVKTTRKASSFAGTYREYPIVVDWLWPAVLESITFYAVEKYQRDSEDTYVDQYRYHDEVKDAYSGPCKAVVRESWTSTAPAATIPEQMIPKAITWQFLLSQGSIQATLHPSFNITEVVGTEHPEYPYSVNTLSVDATNYTDWPATIVGRITSSPYRGGFLNKRFTIYKPE